MQISNEEILHIAKLARLNLKDTEIEDYKKNLEEILDFADTINRVDTIGTNENYNVFRKDEIRHEDNKEELLSNAPSKDDGMFRIPKVIN